MSAAEPPQGANSAPSGQRSGDSRKRGDPTTSAAAASIPLVPLADGARVPALGMGTWRMGENRRHRTREITALRAGWDAGMTLVDTAEMYGDGGAEDLVAQALSQRRDGTFVVSKLYPHNAGAKSALAACERSLRRLRTDRLDLYLLHWRGPIPLAETVDAFERLRKEGKILRWGVSNFDTDDLDELLALPEGSHCAVNQVLYHLNERGIEWSLSRLCRRHAIAVMAYSPFDEGRLLGDANLSRIARPLGVTPAQLALAWLLHHDDVIAIPKAGSVQHVEDNRAACAIRLDSTTLEKLDAAFPPPRHPTRLAVI